MKEAGALARWWVWANEPCSTWPARAADPYTGPWNRTTAHPVLVVNPVYDPATPYRAGQAMTAELVRARLLTLDGYGHTALDNPSACVKQHVTRYVLTGALPPQGARCGQDTPPFTDPGESSSATASTRPGGTGRQEAGPSALRSLRPPGLFPLRPGGAGAGVSLVEDGRAIRTWPPAWLPKAGR
ncbi:alpha/beta hydrolase [Streptomyces sp. NPDC097981]|uniref:alpha/beta hydrolase n=1 Tax=Streptomyces sp. NPDC097981 TaxID=3155428 RepID=UPI0033300BC3